MKQAASFDQPHLMNKSYFMHTATITASTCEGQLCRETLVL